MKAAQDLGFAFDSLKNNISDKQPFLIAAAFIALWSMSAVGLHSAQFVDNLEQYVWSHSFEFGYWKHPPIPTWLLGALIRGVGFSAYWTYGLAAVCFVGTAFFTWRLTSKIFNQNVATLVVLFLSLHIGFSLRAELYNHNTVMILFISATAWTTALAIEKNSKNSWLIVGALAGMAMLSKYQALIPLTGILLSLHLGGWLKQKNVQFGVFIAILLAFSIFSPHLIWVIMSDGSTVENVLKSAENHGLVKRIVMLIGFWLVQLRMHMPILVAVAFLCLLKKTNAKYVEIKTDLSSQQRAWLIGLIAWPILVVSLIALLGGVRLEAQWGLQSFQFVVIFVAWRCWLVTPQLRFKQIAGVVAVSQGIFAAFIIWSMVQPSNVLWKGRRDRNFPSEYVSHTLTNKWKSITNCQLYYVVGDVLEAASVSIHSGQNPAILEVGDYKKSPWINSNQLEIHGAIHISANELNMPTESTFRGKIVMPPNANDLQPERILHWGIVSPKSECYP